MDEPNSVRKVDQVGLIQPGRLGIIPRGSEWIYVTWEWSSDEIDELAGVADNLIIRVRKKGQSRDKAMEFEVIREASGWFIPISERDEELAIELGYFNAGAVSGWACLSRGHWPGLAGVGTSGSEVKAGGNPSQHFPFNHVESWGQPSAFNVGGGAVSSISSGAISSAGHNTVPGNDSQVSGLFSANTPQHFPSVNQDMVFGPGGVNTQTPTIEHAIYGKVEQGQRVFYNGCEVDVINGVYSFRVRLPENKTSMVVELAVVSADGKMREVRAIEISCHIQNVEFPPVPGIENRIKQDT